MSIETTMESLLSLSPLLEISSVLKTTPDSRWDGWRYESLRGIGLQRRFRPVSDPFGWPSYTMWILRPWIREIRIMKHIVHDNHVMHLYYFDFPSCWIRFSQAEKRIRALPGSLSLTSTDGLIKLEVICEEVLHTTLCHQCQMLPNLNQALVRTVCLRHVH